MTIQRFIEAAIEGGWNNGYQLFGYLGEGFFDTWNSAHSQTRWTFEQILLDPEAWKAYHRAISLPKVHSEQTIAMAAEQDMVDMVRALNGKSPKTIEQYLETL